MRALGKGSIAEIIRVGLVLAWALLWVSAAALVAGAVAYTLHAAGIVNLSPVFGPNTHISVDDNVIVTPAATLSWPPWVKLVRLSEPLSARAVDAVVVLPMKVVLAPAVVANAPTR